MSHIHPQPYTKCNDFFSALFVQECVSLTLLIKIYQFLGCYC